MSSIVRRAGSKLLRMLTSSADRAAEVDHVVGYAKAVVGVSQFFGRAPDGRISQVTPAVRLVTPGENLAATIAAYPGETIHLLPGNHVLAADVASTNETLHFRKGAVLQIGANRTLGSNLDFSEAGLVQPTGAFTFTPTGKINLPPSHYGFDPRFGGIFHIAAKALPDLTPENFGCTNADYVFNTTGQPNLVNDTFTKVDHGLTTGQLIGFNTTGTLPTGIDISTPVYAIVVDADTFKVASTFADAQANTWIDLAGAPAGVHTVLVFEDVFLRAWRDTCQWSSASGHGGIQPVVLPGLGYLCGGLLDSRVIQWNGVENHKEWCCLHWSNYNMKIRGPGPRLSSIHFRPLDQLGAVNDEYQLLKWEIADDSSPITTCGISGVFLRAGNSPDVTKVAMYCHDIRDFRCYDVEVNNWSSTRRRSAWLRLAGRDANVFSNVKTNCDIPVIIDYNTKESVSLDANGIPNWQALGNDAVLRDRKDDDHNTFANCDFGVVDASSDPNPWRACIWRKPGTVGRNLAVATEGDCVGGIIVARDYLDGPDQNLGARAGNNFTVMAHGRTVADEVYFSTTGAAPAGLVAKTWYYIIVVDPNTIAFASSAQNAIDGTAVVITSDGVGVHTISGTAFGGALVTTRRISNNWRVCSNRIEGIANSHAGVYALDIQKDPNAPLLELTLEDIELASTGDTRRSLNTGSSSYTSNKISGLRAEGVRRIGFGAGYRFGGRYTPMTVDARAQLDFARDSRGRIVSGVLPQDNGYLYPESSAAWDFISKYFARVPMLPAQHFWPGLVAVQDAVLPDGNDASPIDLIPGGADTPDYLVLVAGWTRGWFRFNETTNQKLNMNSVAAALDPTANDVGMSCEFIIDNGWIPGGTQRDIMNPGGGNSGPLLRFNVDGTLFIRADATNGPSSRYTYNDGVHTRAYLSVVHGLQKIRCWLRKATGQQEVIEVTYSAVLSNGAAKCFGAFDAIRRSFAGVLLPGEHRNGEAARVIGYRLFDALGFQHRGYFYDKNVHRRDDLGALVPAYGSASTVVLGTGSARDSEDYGDVILPVPATLDIAAAGLNGLDTGAEAASTWYSIWAISDSTGGQPPGGIFSTRSDGPLSPAGYDLQRRQGWVRNDAGSNFIRFNQRLIGKSRITWYDTDLANVVVLHVLSGASAVVFTDVSLVSRVPPTAKNVRLLVGFEADALGDSLQLRIGGGTAADGPFSFVADTLEPHTFEVEMPCSATQIIQYKATSANDAVDIWVLGYDDDL